MTALRLLVVAQQLRRATPGGIGTYVRGLVTALAAGGGDADAHASASASADAEADADAHADANADAHAEANADAHADANADAHADANADAHADANADAHRDAHGDAHAGADGLAVSLLASRAPKGADPVAELGLAVLTSPLPAPLLTRAWHAGLLGAPTGFDVVHAASFNAPRSASPLTIAVHDLAWRVVPDTFPDHGRRWHDAALSKAMRRATRLLVPSAVAADQLMAAGAGAGQVEVVDPMYGCDHLPPPDAGAATALLSNLGVTGPYLLSVGTLEPRKNLVRLMEAYGRARSSFPEPWPLVLVGPKGWGDDPSTHLPGGVVLAGAVAGPVLTALYAGARAVAYVPLHEGFGLPAVEAMSAGAPVVATPMPSTGGAALEADPLDIEAIAGALVDAATDERCRQDLISAGRARAGRLTWAAAAARHVELWERLT